MNLFKKVLIVGLATMALGSAAMGDPVKPSCEGMPDAKVKPIENNTGQPAAAPGGTTAGQVINNTPPPANPPQ